VGGCCAAPGLDLIGEEPRLGRLVAAPRRGELTRPELLHAVDDADDATVLTVVRIGAGSAVRCQRRRGLPVRVRDPCRRTSAATAAEQHHDRDDEPDDAAAATDGETATRNPGEATTGPALVVNLGGVEPGAWVEPHGDV